MTLLIALSLLCLIFISSQALEKSESIKPHFWEKAENARWLAHANIWGTLSTTSIHLNGQAWGQPKSFADGSKSNSTGVLYFYDSDMDTSIQDTQADNRVSFALTEAQRGFCTADHLDPEDPRCARVVFAGSFVEVVDEEEAADALAFLFDRHPAMEEWPVDHNWKIHKIDLSEIWLIDIYGGAAIVDVDDYYAVKDVTSLTPSLRT